MPATLFKRLFWFSALGLGITAPIIYLLYWPSGGGLDVTGYHLGRDFINVWTGPKIVDRFGASMLLDLAGYRWAQSDIFGFMILFHNWSYPIDMLFVAYPFSWLPYIPAFMLWTLLGLGIYFVVVGIEIPGDQRKLALTFLLVAPATIVNLVGGQNGFFTAALVLGAIMLLERRPWLAGVLVGLLTLKPHLGFLLGVALLTTFAWRAVLSAAVTAAVLVAGSVAIWGVDPWVTYLTETSAYTFSILAGFLGPQKFMTLSVLSSMRAFGLPAAIAETLQATASLCAIAVTAMMFRRTQDFALRALLIASGTFLASPYVFNYDLPMLTAAVLWVMVQHRVSIGETAVLGLAWIVAGATWSLHIAGLGLSPIAYGGAFLIAIRLIARQSVETSAPESCAIPQAA